METVCWVEMRGSPVGSLSAALAQVLTLKQVVQCL